MNRINRFYIIVLVTLITIYLIILAGGIVRSTGSGMGCPDWPKCFGNYMPPTEESQLPADYKEKYAVQGHPAEFNVYKTWTEYGNRLIGALGGIIVFLQCLYAVRFIKTIPKFFWLSLLLFFLMGFQGVLGAKLVFSFLKPIMITLHMAVALVILGILIYLFIEVHKAKLALKGIHEEFEQDAVSKKYTWVMWVFIFMTALQIFLGTEVREEIDIISFTLSYEHREFWIDSIGRIFVIHRSYSILLTLSTLYFTYVLYQNRETYTKAYKHALAITYIIGVEILAGIILAYFALPSWAQPVHLLLATILLGAQIAFVFRFMVGQNRRSV